MLCTVWGLALNPLFSLLVDRSLQRICCDDQLHGASVHTIHYESAPKLLLLGGLFSEVKPRLLFNAFGYERLIPQVEKQEYV